jgi:hypothetical protein
VKSYIRPEREVELDLLSKRKREYLEKVKALQDEFRDIIPPTTATQRDGDSEEVGSDAGGGVMMIDTTSR